MSDDSKDKHSENSTRARNRTVMITPEMTGSVRSQLTIPLSGGVNPPQIDTEEDDAPFVSAPQRSSSFGHSYLAATPVAEDSDTDSDWVRPISTIPEPEAEAEHEESVPAPKPKLLAVDVKQAAPVLGDEAVWLNPTQLVGFLVSFDKDPLGAYLELRAGRIIVTSEREGSGNYILVDDKSVSPMHAIMRVGVDGGLQILDQLSEHGTRVVQFGTGEELTLSGDKATLGHGDVVRFGSRSFKVCLISNEAH